MAKSKYDDRRVRLTQKDIENIECLCRIYIRPEQIHNVALPTELLPNELKQDDELIESLDYTVPREPIYCAKCNTVIPVAMIQSVTRCPFCHKEF